MTVSSPGLATHTSVPSEEIPTGAASRLGSGHATGIGYFWLRLFKRLLTYMRSMKYPAASSTITTRIARNAGWLLRIGAAITNTIEEYMSNGNRCRIRWLGRCCSVAVEHVQHRLLLSRD